VAPGKKLLKKYEAFRRSLNKRNQLKDGTVLENTPEKKKKPKVVGRGV